MTVVEPAMAQPAAKELIRLDLGSGSERHVPGFTTLDANPAHEPDMVATVPPIPLPDESCAEVRASHFLEHLSGEDASALLAEVWRVLAPGGVARFTVPYAFSDWAVMDPTHRSQWVPERFLYYTPHYRYLDYGLETRFQVVHWAWTPNEVFVDLIKDSSGTEDCQCPLHNAYQKETNDGRNDLHSLQPGGVEEGRRQGRQVLFLPGNEAGARDRGAGRQVRRILWVHPPAQWSTADVSQGYLRAVMAMGHEVQVYNTPARIKYHSAAMGDELCESNPAALALQVSDSIVVEAMRFGADLVFIVNGHSTHPNSIALVRQAGFPVGCLFTESPYEDEDQLHFAQFCTPGLVFCNERLSAKRYGWHYLPHAYDPRLHRSGTAADEGFRSDVLMIASGWAERQRLLEAIDWTGIDFKLHGVFVDLDEKSPIWDKYVFHMLDNRYIAEAYAATKIVLNHHRYAARAESLNPRAFEAAACGAFMLTDERQEGTEIFGDVVPVYRDAGECEALIRHFLAHPVERAERAAEAQRRIQGHTFTARASELMAVIDQTLGWVSITYYVSGE